MGPSVSAPHDIEIAELVARHPGTVRLTVALRQTILLQGPPSHQMMLPPGTPLHTSTAQDLELSLSELLNKPFDQSEVRFGVAIILGLDPRDPPVQIEALIDDWLDEHTVLAVACAAAGEIPSQGLVTGLLRAWVKEHGSLDSSGSSH